MEGEAVAGEGGDRLGEFWGVRVFGSVGLLLLVVGLGTEGVEGGFDAEAAFAAAAFGGGFFGSGEGEGAEGKGEREEGGGGF